MRPHTSARVLQSLGLAATIALVAACGSHSDHSESASTPAATSASATPAADSDSGSGSASSASPTSGGASGTASPTGSASGAGSASAALPTDPGDYGDALVAAWSAGDDAAVARYAAPGAASSLTAATKAPDLLRVACEDTMCSYANEQDRRVTLTFDEKKLEAGAPGAVTSVAVE